MVEVIARTNGKPIKCTYSSTRIHPSLKTEMANLYLQINDLTVSIAFESSEEYLNFCKNHNFPYKDEREIIPTAPHASLGFKTENTATSKSAA
jgi:hypothetical protein